MKTIQDGQCDDDGFVSSGISAESIKEGEMTQAKVAEHAIVLTRLRADIIAFSRVCPHAAADLAAGHLRKGRISCPEHGWKFDLRSGRTLWPEDEACRLKTFKVRVEGGLVWVQVQLPL